MKIENNIKRLGHAKYAVKRLFGEKNVPKGDNL